MDQWPGSELHISILIRCLAEARTYACGLASATRGRMTGFMSRNPAIRLYEFAVAQHCAHIRKAITPISTKIAAQPRSRLIQNRVNAARPSCR